MFAIIYQPSHNDATLFIDNKFISIRGKWIIDTDEDGNVAMIDDIETALNRVKDIRKKGGEACLAAILE